MKYDEYEARVNELKKKHPGAILFHKPPDRPDLVGNYMYDLWVMIWNMVEREAKKRGITNEEMLAYMYRPEFR